MKKIFKWVFLIIFLFLILYLIPTPYFLNAPGAALPCSKAVRIEKKTKPRFKGEFYLTTVFYSKVNLLFYLYALFNPDVELTKPASSGLDYRYYNDFMDYEMEKSKILAKVAALRQAGYTVEIKNYGVRVLAVDKLSKSGGILKSADIILRVNDKAVRDVKGLNEIVRSYRPGDKILLKVSRKNKIKYLNVQLIELNRQTAIGIYVSNNFTIGKLPLDIKISTRFINGSSAGLMLALEILREILNEDISCGRKISGTGTINEDGAVGEVIGIKYKIKAARDRGVKFFLVPYKNFPEASSFSESMVVIPVKDLKSAVEKIKKID